MSSFPVQIGGRWTGMIVLCLEEQPLRFTQLRQALGRSLLQPIEAARIWARDHLDELQRARSNQA